MSKDNTGGLAEGFYGEIGGSVQFLDIAEIDENGAHARAMLSAELAARAARRGLWGAC